MSRLAIVLAALTVTSLMSDLTQGRAKAANPPVPNDVGALPSSTGTLTGLTRKGRNFYYDGNPIYLVGVDAQQWASDTTINYTMFLDTMQIYRINNVRVWVDPYFRLATAGGLHPWIYDTATGRYDLDTWNATYWSRLKAFVSAAQDRGIMVEVSIMSTYPANPSLWTSTVRRFAWNKSFNSNNAFTTNSAGHYGPEFWASPVPSEVSSTGHKIDYYQKALIDKTIAELAPYRNVRYELMNEAYEQYSNFTNGAAIITAWQQLWTDYISSQTDRLVGVHVAQSSYTLSNAGPSAFWSRPAIDVLTWHPYDTNPKSISAGLHSSQTSGKVLQNNESFASATASVGHDNGTGNSKGAYDASAGEANVREAWGWFMNGGRYDFYNAGTYWYTGMSKLYRMMKALSDFATLIGPHTFSPIDGSGNQHDTLVTQGPAGANWQVLADTTNQKYVAYFWGTPAATNVLMNLPAGDYRYRWFDTRNGSELAAGTVSGAGMRSIKSPSPTAWSGRVGAALFIQRTSR